MHMMQLKCRKLCDKIKFQVFEMASLLPTTDKQGVTSHPGTKPGQGV